MSETGVILPAANLPREARVLLIAIAEGESDPVAKREGISPYFILVGGGSFEQMPDLRGANGFPSWDGRRFPTGISHAAGRYQFQPATWKGTVKMFPAGSVPAFRNPGDQDWGAWLLAQSDYRARTQGSLMAALQDEELSGVGGILQPTWTSMSNGTFPARYAKALAAIPIDESTPEPPPIPAPIPVPIQPMPVNPVLPIISLHDNHFVVYMDVRTRDQVEVLKKMIDSAAEFLPP